MIECMKIVKSKQYDLLANYDRMHENCQMQINVISQEAIIDCTEIVKANQYHLLENYDRTHENSESKLMSSLSKL